MRSLNLELESFVPFSAAPGSFVERSSRSSAVDVEEQVGSDPPL